MKAKIKKCIKFLTILLVVLVVSEISANIIIYYGLNIERKEYLTYYNKNPKLKSISWLQKFTPHPYFGYEDQRIRDFEKAEIDKANEFVIGILGASVGASLGHYIEKHTDYFDDIRGLVPNLGAKDIVIANLTLGAGKQPQQFMIAAYFIDDLDMIINIDGFNDASSAHFLPVYPLEFPITSLKYLERTNKGESYATMARFLRWVYISMHRLPKLQPSRVPQSSLYFAFWYVTNSPLFDLIKTLEGKYYTAAIEDDSTGEHDDVSPTEVMERRAEIWKKFTVRQFRFVSDVAKKPIFFFVPPNQYLKGSKPFSEEEKKIALNSGNADLVHERMVLIKEEIGYLKQQGVTIYDLTGIFNNTKNTVYIDSCCHVNSVGNQILAEQIVEKIRQYYEK